MVIPICRGYVIRKVDARAGLGCDQAAAPAGRPLIGAAAEITNSPAASATAPGRSSPTESASCSKIPSSRAVEGCSMLDSLRNFIASDDHENNEVKLEDANQSRVFNGLWTRAANALPTVNLASLRSRASGAASPRDSLYNVNAGHDGTADASRASSVLEDEKLDDRLSRRRSASMPPPDRQRQSLRTRAMLVKNMALLDLRNRANALDLRLPSFHFSLPFSDSNSHIDAQDTTIDQFLTLHREKSDTASINSLTSLEIESLATNIKAENNRLRGLIEGLPIPKIGIPGTNPTKETFAGLSESTKDVNIVVLGGYRGSVLRSAQDHRMLWIPVKVGLGIRKVDLELPLDESAEKNATNTIVPDCMLSSIGPVDVSRRLLKRLKDMEERGFCKVHDYGYDWRLGGQYLSDQLTQFLEKLPGKALVIAHSLGGLITTHVLNRRPDLFQGVLFAGTPFAGCPNILGPFRYGDGVLLNKEILNARTNFSMRSSFILLPTHKRCFVDIESGKELPIDFFDPNSWAEFGLSPEVAKDRGAGDIGEGDNPGGIMASGGVGGPAAGNSTNQHSKLSPAKPNHSSRSPSPRPGSSRQAEDPNRINLALEYLDRTLKETSKFKSELLYNPDINYPPIALLRSSTTPTVRGCSVIGYQGIKDGDYSKFIFSPGDGVVTYAASDIRTFDQDQNSSEENGYARYVVKDVENDRGHIGLLGDLKGVELCLSAILSTIKQQQSDGEQARTVKPAGSYPLPASAANSSSLFPIRQQVQAAV